MDYFRGLLLVLVISVSCLIFVGYFEKQSEIDGSSAAITVPTTTVQSGQYLTSTIVIGNQQGQIKAQLFSNYNCGYCKLFDALLHKYVESRPEVSIAFQHNFQAKSISDKTKALISECAWNELGNGGYDQQILYNYSNSSTIISNISDNVDIRYQIHECLQESLNRVPAHVVSDLEYSERNNLYSTPIFIYDKVAYSGVLTSAQLDEILSISESQ